MPNCYETLPTCVWSLIFQFDITYHEKYKNVLGEFKRATYKQKIEPINLEIKRLREDRFGDGPTRLSNLRQMCKKIKQKRSLMIHGIVENDIQKYRVKTFNRVREEVVLNSPFLEMMGNLYLVDATNEYTPCGKKCIQVWLGFNFCTENEEFHETSALIGYNLQHSLQRNYDYFYRLLFGGVFAEKELRHYTTPSSELYPCSCCFR